VYQPTRSPTVTGACWKSHEPSPSNPKFCCSTSGAGKTTTLRTLAGLLRPTSGKITYDGQAIGGLAAHEVANMGLALVPEGRQLFPEHTVLENLELGGYRHLWRGARAEFDREIGKVFELFPRIKERLRQPAGLLSGGEQQMVAIGRG
jgi:branched-chain amino acid transport system ATP-binding protein